MFAMRENYSVRKRGTTCNILEYNACLKTKPKTKKHPSFFLNINIHEARNWVLFCSFILDFTVDIFRCFTALSRAYLRQIFI